MAMRFHLSFGVSYKPRKTKTYLCTTKLLLISALVSPFMVGYVVASDKDTNALIGFKIDWRLVAC